MIVNDWNGTHIPIANKKKNEKKTKRTRNVKNNKPKSKKQNYKKISKLLIIRRKHRMTISLSDKNIIYKNSNWLVLMCLKEYSVQVLLRRGEVWGMRCLVWPFTLNRMRAKFIVISIVSIIRFVIETFIQYVLTYDWHAYHR